jgi:hypothetical protein
MLGRVAYLGWSLPQHGSCGGMSLHTTVPWLQILIAAPYTVTVRTFTKHMLWVNLFLLLLGLRIHFTCEKHYEMNIICVLVVECQQRMR